MNKNPPLSPLYETVHKKECIIWTPDGNSMTQERQIAMENPVVFEYNCVSHAVMMATAENLTDYIYGFSLTEGIIQDAQDIIAVQIEEKDQGIVARIEITPKSFENLEKSRRVLTGRTGCGLCGADRLEHIIRPLKKVVSDVKIKASTLHQAMEDIQHKQVLNKITGAMHAAGFVTQEGEILIVREDIGRHNALDKLIGAMMIQNISPDQGFALITSRCSFEMVHKCASFGIPIIAAVSAPTELALKLAQENQISLAAFVRKSGLNIYHNALNRITL